MIKKENKNGLEYETDFSDLGDEVDMGSWGFTGKSYDLALLEDFEDALVEQNINATEDKREFKQVRECDSDLHLKAHLMHEPETYSQR